MERIKPNEHAAASMPTTAEAIQRAAAALQPILPPGFFGRVVFLFENGRPMRMLKEESIKL